VTIEITPVNNPPVAAGAALAGEEDAPLAVSLSANDADGDTLTYTISTPPAQGILSGAAPDLIYTPHADWNGTDSFAFSVSDGIAVSTPALIILEVAPVNDLPVATAALVSGTEDTPLAVTVSGSDADGDSLAYTITTLPLHGSLSGTAPHLLYAPDSNWNGTDTFAITASDGVATSAPVTISLSISAVNDVPAAAAMGVETAEDMAKTITLSGTDPDGDPLTAVLTTLPLHGTLSGTLPDVIYTPEANWHGADSFSFVVTDGPSVSPPVEVVVTVAPANDRPVATSQSLMGLEGGSVPVTLAGADGDGDSLTYSISLQPSHGILSGTAPNLLYTPASLWHGLDSFSFTVSDGLESSLPVAVTIEILPANEAPVAAAGALAGDEDVALPVTLQGSDADGDEMTFIITVPPARGALSGTAPDFLYTPDANWHGSDSLAFTVSDGTATSAPAVIEITVNPVNDAPVANTLAVSSEVNLPVAFELMGSDPDGDALTWTVLTNPQGGVLTGTAPALTYTPNLAFSGGDSFTFSVSDGNAVSAPAEVTLTVASAGPWQMVARTGDAAPGAGGALFSALQTDFVSDTAGRASFRATAGSLTGIWTEGSNGLAPVVLQGAAAPGVSGAIFDAVTTGPWAAGDGELLIFGRLLAGTGGVTTSSDYGFWLRGGGAPNLVARENNPVPGMPPAARFNTLSAVATLEAGGNYVYAATLKTNSSLGITTANDTGLWGTFGASQRMLLRENDSAPGAPGGVFDTLTSARLTSNGAGQFGLTCGMKVAGSVTNANRYGLWLRDSLQVGLVARGGNAAPGTGAGVVFAQPLDPALDGSFAFRSTLSTGSGGVTQSNDTGLWLLEEGTVSLLAREGSQAPGIPAGGLFAGLTEGAAVNSAGDLAFRATLTNGGGVKSFNNAGVWIRSHFTGGTVALAARKGSIAPGAGAGTFASFDYPFIADDGREAFTATLTGNTAAGVTTANDRGLWMRSAAGQLVLVLREGAAFTLAPDSTRTVSAVTLPVTRTSGRTPLSADGRLLILIGFSDGTTALYHYAMP
jgi:hypothetical protein